MADASSVRRASTLPNATGSMASSIRFSNNRLWFSDGTAWLPIAVDSGAVTAVANWLDETPSDTAFYTATSAVRVVGVKYVHAVKETTTTDLTAKITKDKPADSAGAGVTVASGLTCTSTANTVQSGTLTSTAADLVLSKGDKLAFKLSGSVNELDNVSVTVTMVPAVENKVILSIPLSTTGGAAAETIFIADRAYTVSAISEVHATAGTDGSAVTAQVLKATGTTAPASGTTLMSNTFDMKGTAATAQHATLATTAGLQSLAVGDRLAWKITGTTTSLATPVLTLTLTPA